MTSMESTEITHLTPILNVSDVAASIAWFGRWGWRECWRWVDGEGGGMNVAGVPGFAAVAVWDGYHDRAQIFLCRDGQGGRGLPPAGTDYESTSRGVWMSVWTKDVDALHARCVREGLTILMPPKNEPWGVREFHLQHPDGHVFRLSMGVGEA